jgi:hypothetical protein
MEEVTDAMLDQALNEFNQALEKCMNEDQSYVLVDNTNRFRVLIALQFAADALKRAVESEKGSQTT